MGDKFKVGDKVVFIDSYYNWLGVEGVIEEIDPGNLWPYMVKHPKDDIAAPCAADEIRLVEEKQ